MKARRIGLAVTGPPSRSADPICDGLRDRGHEVEHVAWDDPRSDWSAYDSVFIRSPHSYLERHGEFLSWADRAASVTDLWNPVELIRWNVHRMYLLDLMSRGVVVLPTVVAGSDGSESLEEICRERGWERAVLKPAISAGGLGVVVVDAVDRDGEVQLAARRRFGDVVVQPYVDSIHSVGELRVAMISGEPVAAARRLPTGDDFGVQAHKMNGAGPTDVPDEAAEVARSALRALGRRTVHARADMLLLNDEWHLAELQLVEPDRMLRDVPESSEALVDALDGLVR